MAYGKIQVDEIENSSGDAFDLSHSSLNGTDSADSHPASAISTDYDVTVSDVVDNYVTKSANLSDKLPRYRVSYGNTGVNILTSNGTASVRENSIVWFPNKNKYYMIADVVEQDNDYWPNSFRSEIGLWSSEDLVNWEYLGICIEQGGVVGTYGVASPSGVAVRDGKILVPFSARQSSNHSVRVAGLAVSTTDPELIPWSIKDETLSDLNFSDDCALVNIPGDAYTYFYQRYLPVGADDKVITVSRSLTPEDVSSWSEAVTVLDFVDDSMELTDAFYYNNQVHLITKSTGTATSYSGTEHYASYNPLGDFSEFNESRLNVEDEPSDIYGKGHITNVFKNGVLQGYAWTVGTNPYYVRYYPTTINDSAKPQLSCDVNGFGYIMDHNIQLRLEGKFTFAIKLNLKSTLGDGDEYVILRKSSDDGDDVGDITMYYSGSDNGLRFDLVDQLGTQYSLTPDRDISPLLVDRDVTIALSVDGNDLLQVSVITDENVYTVISETIDYAFDKVGVPLYLLTDDDYTGTMKAKYYEHSFYNFNLSVNELQDLHFGKYEHNYGYYDDGTYTRSHCVATGGGMIVDQNEYSTYMTVHSDAIVETLGQSDGYIQCKIKSSGTNQLLPDSTDTAITLDSVIVDTNTMSLTDDAITIPKTGIYVIDASIRFATASGGVRNVTINVNGSAVKRETRLPSVAQTDVSVFYSALLSKGDEITLTAYQSSGGDIYTNVSTGMNEMTVTKV